MYDPLLRAQEELNKPLAMQPTQPTSGDELDIPGLDQFHEEPIEWLIPGYLPKEQITMICGTGGTGKTSVWNSLIASLSSGSATLFDGLDRNFSEREPKMCMFFSAEDTVENVIKKKLRVQGAALRNVKTISISDQRFDKIQFGSPYLEKLIDRYRPTICVFDPLQAFIDGKIKMSDRNAMRQNMRCLIEWGKTYGTTFLIVMHTNKQTNVWGRNRMADSADLWDIARSVWMVGDTTEEGIKYLSQEKNNYGKCGRTMLFKNDGGLPTFWNWTDLKDKDYVLMAAQKREDARNRNDIKDAEESILAELSDHPEGSPAKDIDELLEMLGFSARVIRAAKKDLKDRHVIKYVKSGMNAAWIIKKV